MNHSRHVRRGWNLTALIGLALLLAVTVQAQIAVQDGSPLTITHTSGNSTSQPFTVTAGAKVMVVCLEDKGANLTEPTTLAWNGQTLTRDIQTAYTTGVQRSLAIYHLYDPVAGTANITGTLGAGVSDTWVTAYTLNGVDTTFASITGSANTGGDATGVTNLTINLTGVTGGSWAAVNSEFANLGSVTITGTGGAGTSVSDNVDATTTATAGYVASLNASAVTFSNEFVPNAGVGPQKANFAVDVFTPINTVLPSAPTGLNAAAGNAQAALSWTASYYATSYNVKRSTTSGGNYTVIATNVMDTVYTNSGLANGTTYYYVVSAVNQIGESPNSTQAIATPQLTPPPTPTGLAASPGNHQALLSWTASSGATSYNVKRATVNGGIYTTIASPATLSYTDPTTVNGSTYYYVVSAVNTKGESGDSAPVSAKSSLILSSQDGNVVVTFSDSASNLTYSTAYRSAVVIESSSLGVTRNGINLGSGVGIAGYSAYSTSETFASRTGIHALATNAYQGQVITVTNTAGTAYNVNVRVFNNGVAFRYEFTNAGANTITAESSSFVIPSGSTVWADTNTSNYEKYFVSMDIADWATNLNFGPPATIQLAGTNGFLALTESVLGVFGNSFLFKVADVTDRKLKVGYPNNGDGTTGASVTGPVNTPWNVVMIGADLNMIMNNDMVESLAPPPDPTLFPQGTATSWATMGRSLWDWLRQQPGGIIPTNEMFNAMWASRMGIEYITVDEGWALWTNSSGTVDPWPIVKQVVDYSHALGVKVLIWKRSSELNSQAQRTTFFQQLQTAGADGFKEDFFDYSGVNCAAKERVKLQEDTLREAVPYHLVVNYHGTSKPTGQFRTYPNLLNFEAVFGKEQFPNPWMIVSLPFTRFMAGPADYTPLDFAGNNAFEIANVVNMPAPLITFGAKANDIAKSAYASLIRTIPCQWNETRVLSQSQLGQTTATARRKGQDWYIGIMTATITTNWNIPLTFLASNTTYRADIIRQTSTVLETMNVTRDTFLSAAITTTSGSGFVAKIYQVPNFTISANYLLTGSIIGTSGSFAGSGNTIAKVFDGNLTTYFDGPDADGDWAGLDLGNGNQKIVTMIRYCPRATWATRMVLGMFQGANAADFSDAVTLHTVGYTPPDGIFTTVTISNSTAYRYLRYLSPPGGSCNVSEVQFYGAAVPAAPSNLTAAAGANQIVLNWNTVANAGSYNIKRSLTSGGTYTAIATGITNLSYTDSGLLNGTNYYYVASAVSMGLEGANSTETIGATGGPYNLTLTNSWNNGQLTLNWQNGRLLEATHVAGPWTTNAGATSPFLITPNQPQKFYRVILP